MIALETRFQTARGNRDVNDLGLSAVSFRVHVLAKEYFLGSGGEEFFC